MLRKVLLVVLLLAFTGSYLSAGPRLPKNQLDKISRLEYKIKVVGDAIVGISNKPANTVVSHRPLVSDLYTSSFDYAPPESWISSITFTPTGSQSIYDMWSNGSTANIYWDPNFPNNIHAVCVNSPPGDTWNVYPGRRSKYYFSSDKGVSWTFISNVPDIRSGFPTVIALSNGVALIANHSGDAPSLVRTQWFVDQIPGLGSFATLDHPSGMDYIWPRIVATSNITEPNKFVSVGSPNGRDSCFYTMCSNLTAPGTFAPWNYFNSTQAATYSLARGSDGRIGLLYIVNDVALPADYGSIFFMESTNGGNSFSVPTKIYNCNFNTDSLGGLRGVCLTYQGTSPKAVFETIQQTREGTFMPGMPARIRFWSPSLPGSDPNKSIVVADTNTVGYHPYYSGGSTNDVLATLCRPTIGKSSDEAVLFVAFMVPTDWYGGVTDTNSYNSVWFTASGNQGASWKTPLQITPFDTLQPKDWTYPSISPVNDNTGTSMYYCNMAIQSDSMPGTYVNHQGNGESLAQQMFVRVAVAGPIFVNSVSSEIPSSYSLLQNYPNPFNPTTSIKFALPKVASVTLKVYSITGQLVATLVDNETVAAGTSEVKFNASNLSSGIYFYTLSAGDFKETKKMMLVK